MFHAECTFSIPRLTVTQLVIFLARCAKRSVPEATRLHASVVTERLHEQMGHIKLQVTDALRMGIILLTIFSY